MKNLSTGHRHLDLVLGSGLREGGSYLLGAERGVGKTTLTVQLANDIAHTNACDVLVASGEQTESSMKSFQQRTFTENPRVKLYCDTSGLDVHQLAETAARLGSRVLFVDSLQTCWMPGVNSEVGQPATIAASLKRLLEWAETGGVVFVLTHVRKDGRIPTIKNEVLEHVGCVLVLERWRIGSDVTIFGTDGESKYGRQTATALRLGERGFMRADG